MSEERRERQDLNLFNEESLREAFKDNKRPFVVEMDFASFFNKIPHKELMKILKKKIADDKFKGLIGRFLKVGILDQSGKTTTTKRGTPQGSVEASPCLANIYLNEVLDQWFIENHASYNQVMVWMNRSKLKHFYDGAVRTLFKMAKQTESKETL